MVESNPAHLIATYILDLTCILRVCLKIATLISLVCVSYCN